MTALLAASTTAPTTAPTISTSEFWVLMGLTVGGVLLAGVIIIFARSGSASKGDPSKSVIRSWIAMTLVFGLLIFCATAFVVGDSALRSTLFGGLVASVGAAVAFYFSSKTADQARSDVLNAAVALSQGPAGTAPTTFTAAAPPAGTANAPYPGYQFKADGAPAPSFAVGSGPLPNGLKLELDGTLHGTPTTATTYPVSVIAWNAAGAIVSPPFKIVINSAD